MIYVLLIALLVYGVMFTWCILKAMKESNK